MDLKNESETLFIPLFGKALMSKRNLFLKDVKAEEIISNIDYDFKKLKQTKWLSMYMSLRALMIDELCNKYIENNKNTIILHLGCGLDSRCIRINQNFNCFYDIDYDNVINIRKKYYDIDEKHKMIGKSVFDFSWLNEISEIGNILVVAEGLTMYLEEKEIKELLNQLNKKFNNVHLIFDAYSKKAVKLSKIKNPVNRVNADIKYGFDNFEEFLALNEELLYKNSYYIKKEDNELKGITRFIFDNLFCGKFSQSLYMIYEFELG